MSNPMSDLLSTIRSGLADGDRSTPDEASKILPASPGIYAFFARDPRAVDGPLGQRLHERKTNLIYIGQASKSLHTRAYAQDLRHKSPASFFRSLGAVLGYRPPACSLAGKANTNNYRFSSGDTQEIIAWINKHLCVSSWKVRKEALPLLKGLESTLIGEARPILNIQHNPDLWLELKGWREACVRIARG